MHITTQSTIHLYNVIFFQDCIANKSAGQKLLQAATQKAKKTLTNTSPPGKDIIKEHLDSATVGFHMLSAQLEANLAALQDALDKWEEFEGQFDKLSDWLDSVGEAIWVEPELMDDAGQKARQHEEYKVNFTFGCIMLMSQHICDTIKGNESLVENVNFNFLTPLS